MSTLWAVADAGTQALIAQARHAAMQDVLALIERDVAMTRIGAKGPLGAVAQVEIRGLIATAHNRVQSVRDGKWRTLDSRALHNAVTGLSEHDNAVRSDQLARVLGTRWEAQELGPSRSTAWEIAGVPQALMDESPSPTVETWIPWRRQRVSTSSTSSGRVDQRIPKRVSALTRSRVQVSPPPS